MRYKLLKPALPKAIQETSDYYNQLANNADLAAYQQSGWASERSQTLRFTMLSLISDFSGCRVLDLGCGFGGLYDYFQQEEIHCEYSGIDIAETCIQKAQATFPTARFATQDFLDPNYQDKFDFILSSGAMSYQSSFEEVTKNIQKMFNQAHQGVGLNLLSKYTPEAMRYEKSFSYYDPVTVLEFCLSLTQYVELKQSYLPNDFTVYLYK